MSDSVLIVIPTLNESKHIVSVLDSISARLPANTTIVVADGGSTDDTAQKVQHYARQHAFVKLLHNPQKIQSAAVNLAVEKFGLGTEYVIRCDAHAIYPANFISALIETIKRHDADSVVVPMDSRGESCFQNAVAWVSDSLIGSGGSAHRGGNFSGYVDHGHHAIFKTASFIRNKGYDATFTHNEDAEFDCRLRARGMKIYLDGKIRLIYHPAPVSKACSNNISTTARVAHARYEAPYLLAPASICRAGLHWQQLAGLATGTDHAL
jgi:succinoglycan biosynthesis protein ExoA